MLDAVLETLQVERLSDEGREGGLDRLLVAAGTLVRAHEVDARRLHVAPAALLDVLRVLRRIERERREPGLELARGHLAQAHGFGQAPEIHRRSLAERRLDDDVVRGERGALAFGFAAHHDRERLVRDFQRRAQLIARQEREAHIDDDENVHVHGARHVDRQVLRDAAVDQHAIAERDR